MKQTSTAGTPLISALSSAGSIEQLWLDFDRHLEGERGCVQSTRKTYQRESRAFLDFVFANSSIDWAALTAEKIASYVGGRAKTLSLVSRQSPGTAIRSLLRFLTGKGLIRSGLEGAIPRIWRSKHATIPRHLSAEQLESVLALCPSSQPHEKRDRAMLLTAARLGLRPSEELRLSLDDLHWADGCVLIRAGKTSRERMLPIP